MKPSANDVKCCRTIVALQDMIGIKMNDFIIVGEDEYLSFKDEHIVL